MQQHPWIGKQATDIITGFSGTITGRSEYITGCDQFLLQPQAKDGKLSESGWFDENRLRVDEGDVLTLDTSKKHGPCGVAPKK